MSKEDVWSVVGRARFDLDFSGRLMNDFERTVTEAGYKLEPEELKDARRAIEQPAMSSFPIGQADPTLLQKQMTAQAEDMIALGHHRMTLMNQQLDRMSGLTEYMFNTVKQTFHHASTTFKAISWMNWITFGMGISLFAFAAGYAAFSQEKTYSLFFGGLGAASFVTFFIQRPGPRTQRALSNLVQTEIAFMNFFDQITMWESFAQIPRATPGMPPGMPPLPDPANIEKASSMLQERSRETIELLQGYLDDVRDPEARPIRQPRKGERHRTAEEKAEGVAQR